MSFAELDAVMLELSQEEPEVVHTGFIAASIVRVLVGDENAAPVSDSALHKEDPAGTAWEHARFCATTVGRVLHTVEGITSRLCQRNCHEQGVL